MEKSIRLTLLSPLRSDLMPAPESGLLYQYAMIEKSTRFILLSQLRSLRLPHAAGSLDLF